MSVDWNSRHESRSNATRWTRRTVLMIAVASLAIASVAGALVLSLTENAPSVPNGIPVISGCSPLTVTPATVPTNSSGGELYTCGVSPSTLPALTVNAPVTATFTFSKTPASPITNVYAIIPGSGCSGTTTSTIVLFPLPTMQSYSLSSPGYDYCAVFTNAPPTGIPSWTITWSWNQ